MSERIRRHNFLRESKTSEPSDSPTHHQQHFLSMWIMTHLVSAATVCHHLPTSNHDGGKKELTATYHQIFSRIFTPVWTRVKRFQSQRNFWVKCWLAMDPVFRAERKSLVLSRRHKSFSSAAQIVLVSPLFPFDTMAINYIKAGLVNLTGASCKKSNSGTMRIILPCSVCLGPAFRHI